MASGKPTVYYYRLQSAKDNELMASTGRIGGRPPRNIYESPFPKVKALIGRLPADRRGIEFTTEAIPDAGTPPGRVNWSEGSPGVETSVEDELVYITVTITARRD